MEMSLSDFDLLWYIQYSIYSGSQSQCSQISHKRWVINHLAKIRGRGGEEKIGDLKVGLES